MRTIAIVNQKGGCGKTTTTVNLAGCLEAEGMRILVVDMDPQAHATLALGIDPEALDENLYEVLAEPDGAAGLARIVQIHSERIHVAPSGIVLSALEQKLTAERADARTERLQAALATDDIRNHVPRTPTLYLLLACVTLNRTRPDTELVVGTWSDGRVGTFRGMRAGKHGYGGTVFGSDGIGALGPYAGYRPLVVEIVKFFRTGKPPVTAEETLEIYAFMEAADESKRQGGASVTLESVMAAAKPTKRKRGS